jgi:regulatory protein
LLSRRELTTAELRQRLLDREIPGDAVEGAIERLTRDGALDDRRAARAIARTHALVKGRGRRRIERELTSRGVSRELSREVLDDLFSEVSEEEALERALRRRLRSGRITGRAQFQKLYQYLMRLGFDGDKAIAALRKHSTKDPDAEP